MIAIIGAGGHAKCVYECFHLNNNEVFAFFDDDPTKIGTDLIDGKKVVGSSDEVITYNNVKSVFIAIGDNHIRLDKFKIFMERGYSLPNALHPRAHISPFADLGEGNFFMAQAVINPGSKVGNSCIINTGATVGHDCLLEDGVQIGPGVNLAGGSQVGEGVFIGIGAKIAPGVKIGPWAIVGAGSVVLNNLPGGSFYFGAPAINRRDK